MAGSSGGRGKSAGSLGILGVNFLFRSEVPGLGRKFRGIEVPGKSGSSRGRGISFGMNPKFQI